MVRQSKRELVEALRLPYRKGRRVDKGRILDQVCAATGYNRKYAIGLFGCGPALRAKRKRGRRPPQGPGGGGGPGTLAAGEYLHTLSAVDVDPRWFEPVALPNRGQKATFEGIQAVRRQLPFPLLGIDCDSGAEFINHHLYAYCLQEQITFTRSRPFHKNDQAYVEQKNWTGVRRVVGSDRYESAQALAALRTVYADLRLWINFFQPVMKLQGKVRIGSKVRKKYDSAQTPYRRALTSAKVAQDTKQELTQVFLALNPTQLRQRLEANLARLWRLPR